MADIEHLAEAAMSGDTLRLRSLAQDWLRTSPSLHDVERPHSTNPEILSIAAALVELFAQRRHEGIPEWVKQTGALKRPLFLVKSATKMKRLRELCERESPEPFRKRNLFAPPTFLEFV
jgi:hypothetical protein